MVLWLFRISLVHWFSQVHHDVGPPGYDDDSSSDASVTAETHSVANNVGLHPAT